MYCQKCGKQIADGAAFCPECGAPQNAAPSSTNLRSTQKNDKRKKKRSPGQIVLGIIILIIGISLIGKALGNGGGSTPTSSAKTPAAQSSDAETSVINGKAKISKAEFDSISTGMSYEDVVKIVGGEGELSSEVNVGNASMDTKIYIWYGNGSTNANVTFQGDKVVAKAQIGLQ